VLSRISIVLTIVRYLGDKPVKHRFSKQVV
jgi:hypothetical protein